MEYRRGRIAQEYRLGSERRRRMRTSPGNSGRLHLARLGRQRRVRGAVGTL